MSERQIAYDYTTQGTITLWQLLFFFLGLRFSFNMQSHILFQILEQNINSSLEKKYTYTLKLVSK
jgi:hypothetical protein